MDIVMRLSHYFALGLCGLSLQGCVVADVVTAPVKAVSKTVDVLTVSQEESDQKRGKKLREKEEKLGKLERERSKADEKCGKGDEKACRKLGEIDADIEEIESAPI